MKNISDIFEQVINDVSLDERVSDGLFKIENNDHMDALREYLIRKGLEEELVKEYCNKVVEGKFPERQAYNDRGMLVTFPDASYKQKAIQKGTHFEEDPTKGQSNVFSQQQQGQQTQSQPQQNAPVKTNLPLSAAASAPTEPSPEQNTGGGNNEDEQQQTNNNMFTTAAPQQNPEPPEGIESDGEETQPPAPKPKSPEEKEADKEAIKKMLKGDDYMLEEVVQWIIHNGPSYLTERFGIKK